MQIGYRYIHVHAAEINLQWVAVRYIASTCQSTLFWVVLIMSMYTHACLYISTEINNSQWVAVRYMSCSALQHVDFPVNLLMRYSNTIMRWHQLTVSCSELQWVAVSCSELQWVAVSCSALQRVNLPVDFVLRCFNRNDFTYLCMPMHFSWNQIKASCSVLHHVNLPVDLVQTYACLCFSAEINSQWVAVRYVSCSALQHVKLPANLLLRNFHQI